MTGTPAGHLPAPCRGAGALRACGAVAARGTSNPTSRHLDREEQWKAASHPLRFRPSVSVPVYGQGGYGVGNGGGEKVPRVLFLCYLPMEGDVRQGVLHPPLLFYSNGCMWSAGDARLVLGPHVQETSTADLQRGAESERTREDATPPPCVLHTRFAREPG